MGKTLRGEAVVHLPRVSNNADHGLLRLARRVKYFQTFLNLEDDKLYPCRKDSYLQYRADIASFQLNAEKISCNVRASSLRVDSMIREANMRRHVAFGFGSGVGRPAIS